MTVKKTTNETTEELKVKRKYHRVPKEYKEFDEDIIKASNKMQEYIGVIKNIISEYTPEIRISKEQWESIKKICLDVTELLKDNENSFIRKDPEDISKQRYSKNPTLLYMVHEHQRMGFIRDYIDRYEHADEEKKPDEYRTYYAWQLYGHLYFYLTEKDKI